MTCIVHISLINLPNNQLQALHFNSYRELRQIRPLQITLHNIRSNGICNVYESSYPIDFILLLVICNGCNGYLAIDD